MRESCATETQSQAATRFLRQEAISREQKREEDSGKWEEKETETHAGYY